MVPFHYRRIDQAFIQELRDKICNAESVVLLGPRYCGKRYLLDRLDELLKVSAVGPVLPLRILADEPLTDASRVRQLLAEAVRRAGGQDAEAPAGGGLLAPIDDLWQRDGKPVVLLASNVDAMAHHLARSFLQDVRTRVEQKRLIVVLTGELNFSELVHGPGSEFNCANQYVLQGFALDEFSGFLSHYARALHLHFQSPESACRALWEITGGSVYLLRLLLAGVQESRARRPDCDDAPVSISEITGFPGFTGIPGVYWMHVFAYAIQLIDRDPPCWIDLERLIRGEDVAVPISSGPPGPLELAGVALRNNGRLDWLRPSCASSFSGGLMTSTWATFTPATTIGTEPSSTSSG